MEFQQLRHLVAAVDCGNLIKASDECNISQSGLSRSIRSLEERLGVQLLIRNSKGVEPTVYGLSIVQRARLILNEVSRSIDELHTIQAEQVGHVTFGVTQNYSYYFIPQLLADLSLAHPGICVRVWTGGFLYLLDQLKVGLIDFQFGLLGPMEEDPDLVVETLREHHSRVIARADHPLAASGREVTPQELSTARWATLRGEGFQRIFGDYFLSQGLASPTQALRTDSIALIRDLVTRSDMLAVLPPEFVMDAIQDGTLAILDCEAPAEQTQVALVFRKRGLITPQSQQIIDRIRERLGRQILAS